MKELHSHRSLLAYRRKVAVLALPVLLATLWPTSAWAQCGVTDLGACVDDAQYNFWYGLATTGWSLDRTLLALTYQLDQFRWWLIEVAFLSAYQVLTTLVSPLIVPIATLTIVLGCLLLLLTPLFGRTNIVSIRHVLIWAVLAPLLLTLSGPLIVQLEQLRTDLGTALFSGASAVAPGAIFGPAGSDMRSPTSLYPANPCGNGSLARPEGSPTLAPDDLAAAALWADAQDIHCPEAAGPSADIPDRFYEAAPAGPGYAYDGSVGELQIASDRSAAIASIQRGATRLFLGLLPCALAVLSALVQLLFALCLVVLWAGLPIGLLFVFFQQTSSGVSGLVGRAVSVLQISWSSSFVLGIIAASLQAAAHLRNATAYIGFAVGAIVLTGYFLFVALDTLKSSIRTLNQTISLTTGLSLTRPVELAGKLVATTAGVAAGMATGGAALALTGLAARQQSGSSTYAAAAAAGRIRPVARLGEVLATMGALDTDGDLYRGLYAGERSSRSWRAARLQMRADAKASDADGQTMRERAEERRLTQALRHADRRPADRIVGAVSDRWRSLVRGEQDSAPAGGEQLSGPAAHQPVGGPQIATAAATALDAHLGDRRYAAFRWSGQRLMVTNRQSETALPPDTQTMPAAQVNRARLLRQGYTVQSNPDGTTSYWQPPRTARSATLPHAPATIPITATTAANPTADAASSQTNDAQAPTIDSEFSTQAADLDTTAAPTSQTTQAQATEQYLAELASMLATPASEVALVRARGMAQAAYYLEIGRPDAAARSAQRALAQLQQLVQPPHAPDRAWPTTPAELARESEATTQALTDVDAAIVRLITQPPAEHTPAQIATSLAALRLRQHRAQARMHAYQAQRDLLQGLPEGDAHV